jgi:uncharacterized OB-fold protein
MKVDKCERCGTEIYYLEDYCEDCKDEMQELAEKEQAQIERQYRRDVL